MTTKDSMVDRIRFQNLESARERLHDAYGINLSADVTPDEWRLAVRGFQKRHLVAHKMGVVDRDYITKAADSEAVLGRRISIRTDEVRELLRIIRKLARSLSSNLTEAANRGS
jgi:glycyl-tRNA synthetase alpha subunit